MKKDSIKNMRINHEVQKELSSIIREVKDPGIHPLTSVARVQVATDLKTCKVFVTVMGEEEDRSSTLEGLRRASSFIRRELAHRLNLRNTPELTFIMDTSIEDAMSMMQKIDAVVKKDEEAAKQRGEVPEEE